MANKRNKTDRGKRHLRHANITLVSKGVEKMVTDRYLESGCSVNVNYRSDTKRIETLQTECEQYADRLQFVQGDIADKDAITEIVRQAIERFGRVDYLINNAGPFVFE